MADFEEPEKIWDEYDWERFLKQQDLKTERYMELLEKYMDNPDRDQIIAREMGWSHTAASEEDSDGLEGLNELNELEDWIAFECGDPSANGALYEEPTAEEFAYECDDEELEQDEAEGFELHPLYQASFSLTIWVDHLFEGLDELENRPSAVRLATNCAVASAKLAAALSDDGTSELGMTIAYLKRALKALTDALDASLLFAREARLSAKVRKELRGRLFQVRDGVVVLMGEYRTEWRRRYGAAE